MLVKCEVKNCKHNICCLHGHVCNKEGITIGYGNKNGEWVFAECMDYVKKYDITDKFEDILKAD